MRHVKLVYQIIEEGLLLKHITAILLAVLLIISVLPFGTVGSETYVPSRTINLVYDDSGSMIRVDSDYVDTWCQAKYAMEVFAGMLGEKETLNIYYMSDYANGSTSAPPKLSLTGSKDASITEANVKKIHDLVTNASATPFDSVKKAYQDLQNVNSDEKWLVVLTDGEFNSTSNSSVESYFNECVADGKTRVMMLSMGPNAAVINPNPDKHIYFEKAKNTTDILSKLTKICNRIFQSNALPISESNEISFNVPMSQLIVFAQGKSVKIENITTSDGKTINASSNVHVEYSKTATTDKNYPANKVVVADNLNGYVATYNADFEVGSYKVNVSGADDIQVYYKPNVSIAAYLFNENNEEVTEKDNLVAGDYRLEFGFINATNGKKVTDTSLLGNIVYHSSIVNTTTNGEKLELQADSGDNVTIKEGKLDIDVTAQFLEYNTVNANLSYQVYCRNDLIFSFEKKPTYTLNTKGFTNPDDALILNVKIDSGDGIVELTKEQWELLGTPTITTTADLGEFKIEKTEEIGKYKVYPTLKDNDPMKTEGGKIPINVEGGFKQGLSSAQGKLDDSFQINNTITFAERAAEWLKENWLKLTLWILLILLILGYIPPFKKYLPRKLKKRPIIECSAEKIGVKDKEVHGKFQRKTLTTLVPYKSETGFVVFSPSPYKKTAQLRAAGGNGIYVTNMKMFAGKEEISFNGMSIDAGRVKPYRISSGSTISLRTAEYTYTCYLNR